MKILLISSIFIGLNFASILPDSHAYRDRSYLRLPTLWHGNRRPQPLDSIRNLDLKLPPIAPTPDAPESSESESDEEETTDDRVVLYKINCDPCMPGWGVKSMCNATSDTVCSPCLAGTWSPKDPHYRPCMTCAKCGPGLYEEYSCISTRDTQCDSCVNARPKFNLDFVRKCTTEDDFINSKDDDVTVFEIQEIDARLKDSKSETDGDADSEEIAADESIPKSIIPEKDIGIDDPEIDDDLGLRTSSPTPPQETKVEKLVAEDADASDEEKKEWTRFLAANRKANDELAEISPRLKIDEKEAESIDEYAPRHRGKFHPIRPLPQIMPVPEEPIQIDADDNPYVVNSEDPPKPSYPPSYHSYPIDSLSHAGEIQRRKAIVVLILTCVVVASVVMFVICYIKDYCKRKYAYNRVLVVNLTQEDREIIRQSANALTRIEKPQQKKFCYSNSTPAITISENPLENYLNSTDDGKVEKEQLLENEISEHP